MSTMTAAPPSPAEVVRKISTIATLPEVTARIISTVEDPRSSPAQLHKIVCHDPALVTRILKVVNSAFYGLPGQVASIERAIVLLGLNAVKNIAVAASLGQLFRGVRLCEGFTAKDLWTHCIAVGVTARELARQMRIPLVDEAFLAGLIHDIGILVSLQVFPDPLREVCEKVKAEGGQFVDVERATIGLDHQDLGAALAELWKFPRSCQLVAGFHHKPDTFGDDNRLLVALVYVADTLVCQQGHGFNLTALHQAIQQPQVGELPVDEGLLSRVGDMLPHLIAGSATIFH
jgi:putative nucleotidyltransferase with HDIG domain